MVSLVLALGVVLLVLVSGPASASDVASERCPHGAISAVGPLDADDVGDTTPDVRCIEP